MFSGKIGLKYSAKNYIPFTKPSKEAKFMLSFPDMNQHMKGNTVKWGKEKLQPRLIFPAWTPMYYAQFQKNRNREVSGGLLGVRDQKRSGEEKWRILTPSAKKQSQTHSDGYSPKSRK